MAGSRLTLPRGNTLVVNFIAADTNGDQHILQGATIYFTVKPSPGWDTVQNDSSATWQVVSTGNTGNTCQFVSSATQTWVQPSTYYWDITIQFQDGSVITAQNGTLLIVGTPTNKAS